ncbi:MAG: RNA polymerase sigma factor (sigma-70 family) [Lysobacterales bacterium]|jgi:RNA polymerase sigma factor (sigma-70 family)
MMANSAFDIEIDEITLAGAKRGDMDACEKIYRLYHTHAFTTAVRVCRCRELAQEVTQEAFITAFRKMAQFRGDSPFWGWLRRVIVNHAISALRKQPNVEVIEFVEHQAWKSGDQEQIGMAMDLDSALQKLSDEDRAIVWLHDVEGYKHQEIAKLFGKTESFSKTRLSRARQQLQNLIEAANREPIANALA